MIVRIMSHGKSFKGVSDYLTHDAEANTTERVDWTHTHNLANDHVPSAVDEMYQTSQNAELLKQEAGVRAGGRATEVPVKHLSLNWSPDDNPTREHMIATTEQFLERMKWQEHQAIFVAHNDKAYAHVHVMLNVVHPETGLRLDDNFERRRAQAWALEYERENGRVYCEQRLKNPAEREDVPTRPAWMAFQKNREEFERHEKSRAENEINSENNPNNPKTMNSAEWRILKEFQKQERLDFFNSGKSEFSELRNSIYREVREEFRERWTFFYSLKRDGTDDDALAALKNGLVADQKVVLEARRDEACQELRETRDGRYRELLDRQGEDRAELRQRQEAGLENEAFFGSLEDRREGAAGTAPFREAAYEVTRRGGEDARGDFFGSDRNSHEYAAERTGGSSDPVGSIGVGFFKVFDSLLSIMEGPAPDRRPSPSETAVLKAAAEETVKHQERQQVEAVREQEAKQRVPWE
jgi:Relaxase/Mobilisation nuclease domain